MELTTIDLVGAWISIALTLCIFSFLYADNPVYKFAEHLFLGVSIGISCTEQYFGTLKPNMFDELAQGDWRKLVPLVLVVLLFLKLNKKHSYLARVSIAFIVAAYAGVKITGEASGNLMTQMTDSMPNLVVLWQDHGLWDWSADGDGVISGLVVVLGLSACLLHFYFSAPHKPAMRWVSRFGILALMLSFGASFGYTVMGRISLCIGRVQEMLGLDRTPEEVAYIQPRLASVVLLSVLIVYLVLWTRSVAGQETQESTAQES